MPNPDYVITKVRYDDDHSRITKVMRGTYDNDENVIGPQSETLRITVVTAIEGGSQHYTCPPDGDGGYTRGDEVEVIVVNGTKFIRTDGNEVEGDNLGELPEF